jgi:hypothetical protein
LKPTLIPHPLPAALEGPLFHAVHAFVVFPQPLEVAPNQNRDDEILSSMNSLTYHAHAEGHALPEQTFTA